MVEEPAKFIGDISIANQVYNPFTTGGHHLVQCHRAGSSAALPSGTRDITLPGTNEDAIYNIKHP